MAANLLPQKDNFAFSWLMSEGIGFGWLNLQTQGEKRLPKLKHLWALVLAAVSK